MGTAAVLIGIYEDIVTGTSILDAAIAAVNLAVDFEYVQLAKGYKNLYVTERDVYNTNFQNNIHGELGLLQQVFQNPLAGNGLPGALYYTPQYLTQVQNIENFDEQNGGGAFSDDIPFPPSSPFPNGWWDTHAHMYNDVPYDYSNDPRGFNALVGEPVTLDKAATLTDFENYFYRYEEHRKDVYDERTTEWQSQSLNFGVKQASVVESGLATSFKFLDISSSNMADLFATQANGLANKSGFISSVDRTAQTLSASAQEGRALAISTNLGVDRKVKESIFSSSFND